MNDLSCFHILEDELEAMRLSDMENLSQIETGERMGVSRGTIQRILNSGRKKLLEAIVNGQAFRIGPSLMSVDRKSIEEDEYESLRTKPGKQGHAGRNP